MNTGSIGDDNAESLGMYADCNSTFSEEKYT